MWWLRFVRRVKEGYGLESSGPIFYFTGCVKVGLTLVGLGSIVEG